MWGEGVMNAIHCRGYIYGLYVVCIYLSNNSCKYLINVLKNVKTTQHNTTTYKLAVSVISIPAACLYMKSGD